jgi:hypothetical protein
VDQLAPILVGLAALITAAGSLELRRRATAKSDATDSFRRLLLIRRVARENPVYTDDVNLAGDIEKEATT